MNNENIIGGQTEDMFSRTELLIGKDAVEKIKASHVAVFGAGGVGGYAIEALVRCGVGSIDIIDNDTVSKSNLNRQIIALRSTIGKYKVDVFEERIKDIDPECNVKIFKTFVLPENINDFDFSEYDHVIDAIDTVSGKLAIIEKAYKENIPVISAMGAGNKLDPGRFEVTDIYKTSGCPLAKVIRSECRKRGIGSLKVVYSKEPAIKVPEQKDENNDNKEQHPIKRSIPGSISYVPASAGLIIAGEVVSFLVR